MKYFKSPMNYTGNKYKLLEQLIPLFPSEINTFVDVFCGGLDVSLNINANTKICNDKEPHIIELYKKFQESSGIEVHDQILSIINKYGLSKTNTEGYLALREEYNKEPNWLLFYCLILYSFNNQIRFNNNGEFNLPHGKNRSSYNSRLQARLPEFVDRLDNVFTFKNQDFRDLDLSMLDSKSFVYADPPYLISLASYNERNGWTEKDDSDLFSWLDELNSHNIKFGLSNVLEHKGKKNTQLEAWSAKYSVHRIDKDYKNCSYNKKEANEQNPTKEVFICNY